MTQDEKRALHYLALMLLKIGETLGSLYYPQIDMRRAFNHSLWKLYDGVMIGLGFTPEASDEETIKELLKLYGRQEDGGR